MANSPTGFDVPTRLIVRVRRGKDGLFVQTPDVGPERETVEQKNRMRFAEHFKFADPYTGNTRTNDELGDYNCGRCNQADGDSCLLVDIKKIDRDAGSCGHWENTCAGDPEMVLRYISPEVASYGVALNGVGFGCHRCPYASRAITPDSRGRDLYCGKGDFRIFGDSCCALNGAETVKSSHMSDTGEAGVSKNLDDSISVDSVHVDGSLPSYASGYENMNKPMADLTTKSRNNLRASQFGDPKNRRYPLPDKSHADNAAARLEQQRGSMSPGEYASIKRRIVAAQKRFGETKKSTDAGSRMRGSGRRGLNMKINSDGSMHIRHMTSDDKCTAVMPGASIELTDSPAPIWNKLAIPGVFNGHPSGAFSMNAQTFTEIERNFKRDGIDVPFDYEHASETPATEPAKAQGEAIASGWIKDIQARADGLYGLVEWTPAARQKILAKEFKYISPAIRFGAIDGKSGEKIGAKLTSSALTNKPFLKALPPALASDNASPAFLCSEVSGEEIATSMADSGGGYMYSANEYLPRLRSAMSMDSLASPDEMKERVERIIDLCGMADGDPNAVVEGIPLSNYIAPLRDYMRMPANTNLYDMLLAVMDMVDACCSDDDADESEESPGAEMSDQLTAPIVTNTEASPAPATIKESNSMAEKTFTLAEHDQAISSAVTKAVSEAISPLTLQIKDLESKIEEAKTVKATDEAKIVSLTDEIKKRDADKANARVTEAFDTYKDIKKLSDDDREMMAITLASKPELFEKLYPKQTPNKSALLTKLSDDRGSLPNPTGRKEVPPLKEIFADVRRKNPALSYDEAFMMASKEHSTLMSAQ